MTKFITIFLISAVAAFASADDLAADSASAENSACDPVDIKIAGFLSDAVLEWKIGYRLSFENENADACVSHMMEDWRASHEKNHPHNSHHSMWCKGCLWGRHRLYN